MNEMLVPALADLAVLPVLLLERYRLLPFLVESRWEWIAMPGVVAVVARNPEIAFATPRDQRYYRIVSAVEQNH